MEQGGRHPVIRKAIDSAPPTARMSCPVDVCGGCGAQPAIGEAQS